MSSRPALITGGCGFVGRHLVKGLLERGSNDIWIVDDLSTGSTPGDWLPGWEKNDSDGVVVFTSGARKITFIKADAWHFFHELAFGRGTIAVPKFGDVFHLASIVGGRALIEGDPLMVAKDFGLDAAFFLWLTRDKDNAQRVLYPSSSAAYPTNMQSQDGSHALAEHHIDFDSGTLGVPDLTYGWSKLTGELLARLAHTKYGVRISVIRPFSGYGEDQDLTYPTPSIALRVARGDDPIEVWGTGEQKRDFIHIDDCVDAMFTIMDNVSDGSAVNIGTGTATSFNELISHMLELEGRTATIKPLSDKPVGVGARYAHTDTLKNKIGWSPRISLKEGLKRTLEGARKRLAGIEMPFSIT